jgi:hypothetical protein
MYNSFTTHISSTTGWIISKLTLCLHARKLCNFYSQQNKTVLIAHEIFFSNSDIRMCVLFCQIYIIISWTDRVRNEEVLLRVKEQRNILHEIRKRKDNWIDHILRRNCLLQQVVSSDVVR